VNKIPNFDGTGTRGRIVGLGLGKCKEGKKMDMGKTDIAEKTTKKILGKSDTVSSDKIVTKCLGKTPKKTVTASDLY